MRKENFRTWQEEGSIGTFELLISTKNSNLALDVNLYDDVKLVSRSRGVKQLSLLARIEAIYPLRGAYSGIQTRIIAKICDT